MNTAKQPVRIVFRADASSRIGMGHVSRCAALARALMSHGDEVSFITREWPGHACDWLQAQGIEVHRLPEPDSGDDSLLGVPLSTELSQVQAILSAHPLPDWLVVDHYGLDAQWERAFSSMGIRILAIDDLADRTHDCDLLLDQNFPGTRGRYDGFLPTRGSQLLGPEFALLGPDFALRRPPVPRITQRVQRILVFFGGADTANLSTRALDAIGRVAGDVEVDVVIGAACPHRAQLAERCRTRPGWHLHVQTAAMAELLGAVDLAIGAGGVAALERCCMGLASLVLSVADNQLAGSRALALAGAHLYLGPAEQVSGAVFDAALRCLIESPILREALAARAHAIVDGRGTQRVVRRLHAPRIALRRAELSDARYVLDWRNHPRTREHIFNPAPIAWEEHLSWFKRVVEDPASALLIGEIDGQPVGVLRFDPLGERVRISIYLDPERHGQGIGSALIDAGTRWLAAERPQVRQVIAEVMPSNTASRKVFAEAGYATHFETLILDLDAAASESRQSS